MADVGGRYAVILASDDGKDVISDIKLMEGAEPEINVDAVDRGYKLEKADDGWMIGMVRGGSVRAVGGFGFEDELAAAGRSDTGVTRIADTKPAEDKSALSPVSHEKQRGLGARTDTAATSTAPADTADKPPAKRRPSRRRAA